MKQDVFFVLILSPDMGTKRYNVYNFLALKSKLFEKKRKNTLFFSFFIESAPKWGKNTKILI